MISAPKVFNLSVIGQDLIQIRAKHVRSRNTGNETYRLGSPFVSQSFRIRKENSYKSSEKMQYCALI
jgi:hypothetical protein